MCSSRWIKGARSVQLDSKFAEFNLNLLSVCVYLCRYFFLSFRIRFIVFFLLVVSLGTMWNVQHVNRMQKLYISRKKFLEFDNKSFRCRDFITKIKIKQVHTIIKLISIDFCLVFLSIPFRNLFFFYIFACGLFMQLLFPVVSLEVFVSPSTRQLNIKYSLKRERYYLRYTVGVYMYFDKQ